MTQPLAVEAEFRQTPITLSMPGWIDVRLTNQGSASVLVNKRLDVGYRTSLDRELFAEVFRRGENEVVSTEALDYQRDGAAASDYVWLQPGETVSGSFDLLRWYTLPGPGEYEVVVSYQADDAVEGYPEGLLTGIYSSQRVPFTVT